MKTSKPLSAISYNSEPYLRAVCATLLKSGLLTNYAYIQHTGEDGDKDHIHLLLFPAKPLDSAKLAPDFCEVVGGEIKPRGIVGLKPCASVVDWVRYCVHDPAYLAVKGERRQYRYRYEDFQVGSSDEWRAVMDEVRFMPLPCPSYGVARVLIEDALRQGGESVTWSQLFRQIPFAPRDLAALREYYHEMRRWLFRLPSETSERVPQQEEWSHVLTPAADSSVRLAAL